MTDGNKLVENLISYAKEYLYLNANDEAYLRLRLYKFFLLKTEDVKKYVGSGEILPTEKLSAVLEDYIVNNFSVQGDVKEVLSEVFAQLTPMPSQIDRTFKNLRERLGSKKAIDYFYGISCANAFVSKEVYEKTISSEQCVSKIYVSDKKRGGLKHLDTDIALQDNARVITFENNSRTYYFGFLKYGDEERHGALALPDGRSVVIDKAVIEDVTSFIEYLPEFSLISSVCGKTSDNIAKCDKFFLMQGDEPVYSCAELAQLRSDFYSDADISICDYPVSCVKFVTFNRNTVIELTHDLIRAFDTYIDDASALVGNAKKNANRTFFSIKILADGRYCVHVFFTRADDFDLYSEKKGFDRLFTTRYFPTVLCGRFVADIAGERSIGFAKKYLMKKGKIDVTENCPEFAAYFKTVDEKQAFTSNEKKASAHIADALLSHLDGYLRSVSAFNVNGGDLLPFKKFLSIVNIK